MLHLVIKMFTIATGLWPLPLGKKKKKNEDVLLHLHVGLTTYRHTKTQSRVEASVTVRHGLSSTGGSMLSPLDVCCPGFPSDRMGWGEGTRGGGEGGKVKEGGVEEGRPHSNARQP